MSGVKKKGVPKRRGRPATGKDPLVSMRVPKNLIKRAEDEAAQAGVSRSAIMRRWLVAGADAELR